MRVIVTRPEREAQDWVLALREVGHEALALPLIAIGSAPDPAAVQRAWRRLGDYDGVMFVSANAVHGFFAQRPTDAISVGQRGGRPKAWATGPGTCRALSQLGVAARDIIAPAPDAPQFDSEALWRLVGSQVERGTRVLIVRGGDAADGMSSQGVGRDWLARQIALAGGAVDWAVSYQRARPRLDADQLQLAQAAAADGTVWLFSSSEAVHNLRGCLPQQNWARALAVATHARIAQAARDIGFGTVLETRPDLSDVRASIESLT